MEPLSYDPGIPFQILRRHFQIEPLLDGPASNRSLQEKKGEPKVRIADERAGERGKLLSHDFLHPVPRELWRRKLKEKPEFFVLLCG